ncbi:MAG: hypothetical protein H7263_03260 [Candidatus Sericytochromatia bacterium]|nr:hypothetical protein [Candidatus Sericytochromatia bacterium]
MAEAFNFSVAGLLPTNSSVKTNDPVGNDINKIVEDFAKLLVSEISNQDPDHPQDSTQSATQYSQMLATLGQIKANNAAVQFGQVQVAKDVIGKTVTYTLGKIQDPTTHKLVDDLRTGIVTSADFTLETPSITVAGGTGTIPVADIRQIFTANQITTVPQAAATVGKNVTYKKVAPNPAYVDATTTPNIAPQTIQSFSGMVTSITLASSDGIPRLTITGEPSPIAMTSVVSVNN